MRTLPGGFAVGFVGKMRWGSDFLCEVKAGVTEKVRGIVSRKAVEGGLFWAVVGIQNGESAKFCCLKAGSRVQSFERITHFLSIKG